MPTRSTRPANTVERAPRLGLSVQTGPRAGKCPVDRSQLRRWVIAALDRDAELTVRFVGRAEARRLNARFRARDYATNVLTFDYTPPSLESRSAPARSRAAASAITHPIAADVVICLPVLVREARAQRKSVRDHLGHLVIHGVLHAQGMDHQAEADARRMERREASILARFRIADPYTDAAR